MVDIPARILKFLLVSYCWTISAVDAWITVTRSFHSTPFSRKRVIRLGLLDSLSQFLQDREGDFVRLDEADSVFGPGPALILYNVPSGIENDEIRDMLEDGAPQASQKGIQLARITAQMNEGLLDQSLQNVVDKVANKQYQTENPPVATDADVLAGCPVLLFSGFMNTEMMSSYNILGEEIYQETGGQASPACAKVVPNAMTKTLRQVLEEISGDHMDAMKTVAQQ